MNDRDLPLLVDRVCTQRVSGGHLRLVWIGWCTIIVPAVAWLLATVLKELVPESMRSLWNAAIVATAVGGIVWTVSITIRHRAWRRRELAAPHRRRQRSGEEVREALDFVAGVAPAPSGDEPMTGTPSEIPGPETIDALFDPLDWGTMKRALDGTPDSAPIAVETNDPNDRGLTVVQPVRLAGVDGDTPAQIDLTERTTPDTASPGLDWGQMKRTLENVPDSTPVILSLKHRGMPRKDVARHLCLVDLGEDASGRIIIDAADGETIPKTATDRPHPVRQ